MNPPKCPIIGLNTVPPNCYIIIQNILNRLLLKTYTVEFLGVQVSFEFLARH